MPFKIQRYGWKPDIPDHRDIVAPLPLRTSGLPPEFSLRSKCPPIYDQMALGSCVSNGIKFAVDFQRMKQGMPPLDGSRLFIYYNGRKIEGDDPAYDSGLQVRTGIKSVVGYGVCPESAWPYNIDQFSVKPTTACYMDAVTHKTLKYQRVLQTLYGLKYQICIKQIPVVFGFTVYESFESKATATTGVMTMPSANDEIVGGHCISAIGFSNAKSAFEVRNSWGPDWGDAGHFWMPYEYATDPGLSDDFWEITLE